MWVKAIFSVTFQLIILVSLITTISLRDAYIFKQRDAINIKNVISINKNWWNNCFNYTCQYNIYSAYNI